ncbi:recombinase family protein [Saccharopolyspora sp. NPDC003762]
MLGRAVGRRVHVLEQDSETAPWVRWLFAERARGRSVASLARELNARGVPCPAGADQARNTHRPVKGWIARTIALILENPRYTGGQVWNRHSPQGHGASGRTGGRGSGVVRRNAVQEWEVSEQLSHRALVDESTFLAVQREVRKDELADLVVCGQCAVGWMRTGCMVVPGIAAAMAPRPLYRGQDRCPVPCTSARITFATPQACSASRVGNHPRMMWETRLVTISAEQAWRSCAATWAGFSGRHQAVQLQS